jgi:hypothetical protein
MPAMSDDIVTRLRELAAKQDAEWSDPTDAPLTMYQVAADEIERLREWKKVADLFGIAFRMDEFGQYPVTNGDDVHQAVLAWERARYKFNDYGVEK